MAKKNADDGRQIVANNKKARHDYAILDTYEAGLALMGTEVKSLRMGRASLVDAFCQFDSRGELWLEHAHIPEYLQGSWTNHSARRRRKLLLHRAELDKIAGKTREAWPHHHPAVAVLRGRQAREGGDRCGARQARVRQAPDPAREAGQP